MTSAIDTLIELLRGRRPAGDRTISPTAQLGEADWKRVLALAEEHGVLPWTVSRMRLFCEALPTGIGERLREVDAGEAKAAFFWCAELKSVLRVFAERRIAIVPLKGPSLAERVYGDVALRPCRDLDLLVAAPDWLPAEETLRATGFAPAREADDYHCAWRRQTAMVELHRDVENPVAFDFHVAGALERSRTAEFHGVPCRLLAPEDELLYLCLHATRHGYDRLSLLLDLRLAFEKLTADEWQPRPEVGELNGLLALGLAMARRLEPALKARWNPEVSEAEWRHIQKIADLLWLRLRTEPIRPLDWGAAHRFYVSLEPTAWRRFRRRLCHASILATRTIDRDREFAAQYGIERDWQIRLLRPVRLLTQRLKKHR